MEMSDITILKRDVEGILIPYGSAINLMPGTEVLVTQALGGSFTVNVNGNLVRIDGKDADALGREPLKTPIDDFVPTGEDISEDIIWAQLRTVFDPEIPVNIVELGLIYEIAKTKQDDGSYHIGIQMTLTAPGCGMGPVIQADAEHKLKQIPNVSKVDAVLVFDPPWSSEMMSEEAKLELGLL